MKGKTPAARASSAAAATQHTREHKQQHAQHRERTDAIARDGREMLVGHGTASSHRLVQSVLDEFGSRLPMMPKETAAVESLTADHLGEPISLTRRDPGETGPLLAHVGDKTYLIDGDTVAVV